jgi:hypothetical protein
MPTVVQACEANFQANKTACNFFVEAVGKAVGVTITGNADEITNVLRAGTNGWSVLANGVAAAAAAGQGKLVVGGLKGSQQARPDPHGHVVVVVPGPLAHGKYPTAWWGSLGGSPGQNQTINWAWTEADRDKVSYASHDVA